MVVSFLGVVGGGQIVIRERLSKCTFCRFMNVLLYIKKITVVKYREKKLYHCGLEVIYN